MRVTFSGNAQQGRAQKVHRFLGESEVDCTFSLGSSRRPTGGHKLEGVLVLRLGQFGGQVAARLFTPQIFDDPLHLRGPS
jgi:hypothetical protein